MNRGDGAKTCGLVEGSPKCITARTKACEAGQPSAPGGFPECSKKEAENEAEADMATTTKGRVMLKMTGPVVLSLAAFLAALAGPVALLGLL